MNITKNNASLEVTFDNGKQYKVWKGLSANGTSYVYERRTANGRWARLDFGRAHNICYELLQLYRKHFETNNLANAAQALGKIEFVTIGGAA